MMSTQVSENQTTNAGKLNAEPRKAARSYKFEIEIFELNGYAAIKWVLEPHYAIGSEDKIYINEGKSMKHEMRVMNHSNTWKTPHVWGSGLNAAYMAWNYETGSAGMRPLVVTPDT
jgi:hypothetical protein